MTRSRSRRAGAALLALLLTGCIERSGAPVAGPLPHDIAYAYIPLKRPVLPMLESDAGGVALGGGVAVTVAHAEAMLDPGTIIGTSADYDLMFFRTDRSGAALTTAAPRLGQHVVSYGQYNGTLYRAEGTVTAVDLNLDPRCARCGPQLAFAFDGNAGPGYSGGPVIDADSGALIGIVFGYRDKPDGGRTIYAYAMREVGGQLKAVELRHN